MPFNKLELIPAGQSRIELPTNYTLQKHCPTYLKIFIDEHQVDFIYKEKYVETTTTPMKKSFDASSHDLTGSPLLLEFAEESFSELNACSNTKNIQLWDSNEEKHSAVLRKDMVMLMNHFLSKKANVKYHPWIWFLVDSGDYILIGSKIIDDFWYCGRIKISPNLIFSDIKLNMLLENFIKENKITHKDVSVAISAEYEVLCRNTENFHLDIAGTDNMKLLAYWNELSLTIPLISGKTILKQFLLVGMKATQLWDQLKFIQDLYNLIKEHQNTSNDMLYKIIMPNISDSNLYTSIDDRLIEMFHKDQDFDLIEDNNTKFSFSQTVHEGRPLSFCDEIFIILKDVSCYSQLVKCFGIIFTTVAQGKINIEVPNNTKIRLESLVHDVFHKRAAIPFITGLQPLELLLEAGVEKLCKDYIYLFGSCNLFHNKLPFYDIPEEISTNTAYSMKPRLTIDPFAKKNTSCNSNDEEIFHNSRFDEKEYKHKFKILSRIHVVLESLIHIENILEVKMDALSGMCSSLMKIVLHEEDPNYKPPNSLKELIQSPFQILHIPFETKEAKTKIGNDPLSLHVKFTTEKETRKICTQHYFNVNPIFPPSIEQPIEDLAEGDKQKLMYNVSCFIEANMI